MAFWNRIPVLNKVKGENGKVKTENEKGKLKFKAEFRRNIIKRLSAPCFKSISPETFMGSILKSGP